MDLGGNESGNFAVGDALNLIFGGNTAHVFNINSGLNLEL